MSRPRQRKEKENERRRPRGAWWRRAPVIVELRAPNYPGSTYTLTHDPKTDQLGGAYFQAVQRQTFDVVFYRAK